MKKELLITTALIFTSSLSFAQYEEGNVYTAARLGQMDAMKKFIESKPDMHTLNTALGAATAGGQLDAMKLLIDTGADVDHYSSFNTSLLINAIMNNEFKAAELLINKGANINIKGYQAIDQKIKVAWFWTPLMCAAYKGDFALVKLLIKKGADPTEEGWSQFPNEPETSADIAAYSGHLKTMKYLIKKGATIHPGTVIKAARGGHIDVIKYFLKKGFDINKRDPFRGRTLIVEASWFGQYDLVKFLLDKGADPEIKDLEGYSAISYAKDSGNQKLIKLLGIN